MEACPRINNVGILSITHISPKKAFLIIVVIIRTHHAGLDYCVALSFLFFCCNVILLAMLMTLIHVMSLIKYASYNIYLSDSGIKSLQRFLITHYTHFHWLKN